MKKMQCLFQRHFLDKGKFELLTNISKGCEWVTEGRGHATIKRDGTAVMFDGNMWFCRYDCKKGDKPFCFYPCEETRDPITNHWPGWTPVNMSNENQYIREAIENYLKFNKPEQTTYEACGPKINGNKEKLDKHILFKHGSETIESCPRTYEGLKLFLSSFQNEGIVFHYNGQMTKIRKNDFGFQW